MNIRYLLAGIAAAAMISTPSWGQTGAGGEFTIHNDTATNIVTGFYTNDGSGWSDNWQIEQLRPGEQAEAKFDAETGACEQVFQVGWLGADGDEVLDDEISIDICDASNVYLGDNEITYD